MEKHYKDIEAKFDMVELLFGGQGKKEFMRLKKTVTNCFEASDNTASIATPRGLTEDSSTMILDKFKNQAFKDFVAMHEVNFLWQNLHKTARVTTGGCIGRLQEISNYLEYILVPDLNVPLTKGDLINILNQMVPVQWRRSMISINFQPFNKTMTQVIEYMEKLDILEATTKQSSIKKSDKEGSENNTEIF